MDQTRAVTGTIKHLNGDPWVDGKLLFFLLALYETAESVYPIDSTAITLDINGRLNEDGNDFILLSVPDVGAATYKARMPDNSYFTFYLEAGPPVDIVTLEVISTMPISQSALQTLLDAESVFTITNVNQAYQVLVTDEYICTTGAIPLTMVPALLTQPPIIVDNFFGAGNVTVTRAGADTINGQNSIVLYPGDRRSFVPVAVGAWRAG